MNNQNFLQWSWFALMVIRGQGHLGYVDGSMKKPDPRDPSFGTWDAQNSMVMVWIVNSMEEDIKESYLYYSTTQDPFGFQISAEISNQSSPSSKQNVSREGTQFLLTKEQMEQLYKLLKPSQDTNTSLLAQRGNFFSVLSSYNNDPKPWVIDSRVTNYMISFIQSLFRKFQS